MVGWGLEQVRCSGELSWIALGGARVHVVSCGFCVRAELAISVTSWRFRLQWKIGCRVLEMGLSILKV